MSVERLSADAKRYLGSFGLSESIQDQAFLLHYKKGDWLCSGGNPMDYLLFLMDGKAKVCMTSKNGKTLLQCFYTPGSILGDVELMADNIGVSDVIAITAVTCIGIPLIYCQDALKNNVEFMRFIGTSLANKLKQCSKNSAANILNTLESRLCAYIDMTNENHEFTDNLTEIAELLGTSYRHLLRSINKLCKDGILEKRSRTHYVIKNIEAIRRQNPNEYATFQSFTLLD
ncbi:cyclic nucleotide-binding domain-containing protein [Sinanaerobacter chloroacetimidivorans]|jgi:CRP/FNR family putative post-exponential-phase nitrogen-starvation transcriptional regulator|uniref:Cyclic nucleotide-binding domain-containing protein n=1 Tax=Sinanaerobacter chloroacetimidivorans TaxID=2818044 RepID=A0A8J8B0N6_9FIRM|nr:cyclic nucleotide-binding domain-containing protein [Sinanaerobacter chloroacetimidivorans]MBR0596816.1 cyclic nucleotide-binding domain-containing protein [Sinanaerobacter chloroacetimidivorans]